MPFDITVIIDSDYHRAEKRKRVRPHRPTIYRFHNLLPETKYRVKIKNVELIESSFTTLSEDCSISDTKKILLVSCNEIKVTKRLEERSPEQNLQRRIADMALNNEIDTILHVGDQVYGDSDYQFDSPDSAFQKSQALMKNVEPENQSDYNQDVRELYRSVYRETQKQTATRLAMANAQNIMISDDHEIADDYSNNPDFHNKKSLFFQIARQAHIVYREYQVQLRKDLTDDSLKQGDHFQIKRGQTALVFIELNTGRTIFQREKNKYELLGDQQQKDLILQFDEANGEFKHIESILFVIPRPIVYIPSSTDLMKCDKIRKDFKQQQSAVYKHQEQKMLLDVMFDQKYAKSGRELVVLSGDSHFGSHTRIKNDSDMSIRQFISSPISNDSLIKFRFSTIKAAVTFGFEIENEYVYLMHNFVQTCNFGVLTIRKDKPSDGIPQHIKMWHVGLKNGHIIKMKTISNHYIEPVEGLVRCLSCRAPLKAKQIMNFDYCVEQRLDGLTNFVARYCER